MIKENFFSCSNPPAIALFHGSIHISLGEGHKSSPLDIEKSVEKVDQLEEHF